MNKWFVSENELLAVYIPPTNKAFVFRVKSIANAGFEAINYGPIPVAAGTSLSTFAGGAVSVPADGVLPADSFTSVGISYPLRGAYDENDMWYLPSDERNRLFHVLHYISPSFIRADVQIPKGVSQGRFMKRVVTGVDKDFGFSRGFIEVIHIPGVHYGYRYANDTNMSVYTFAKFMYREYVVEIPRNPELIFDVLSRRVLVKWYTLPISVVDPAVSSALLDVYGFDGFTVYRADEKQKAVEEYRNVLRGAKI